MVHSFAGSLSGCEQSELQTTKQGILSFWDGCEESALRSQPLGNWPALLVRWWCSEEWQTVAPGGHAPSRTPHFCDMFKKLCHCWWTESPSLWWGLVLTCTFPQSTGSLTAFHCVLWRLVYAHWMCSSPLGQGMIPQTGAPVPQP